MAFCLWKLRCDASPQDLKLVARFSSNSGEAFEKLNHNESILLNDDEHCIVKYM